jgi:putative oxidoreductase
MREMFLLGRLLFGGYFLFNAFNHFANVGMMSQYLASRGIPLPGLAVVATGILLAVGGLSVLLGVYPRIGVAALILFLVPVTLLMHQFWAAEGPARMTETANFTRNLALLGSAMMFSAIPEPWPYSLGSRIHLPRRAPV